MPQTQILCQFLEISTRTKNEETRKTRQNALSSMTIKKRNRKLLSIEIKTSIGALANIVVEGKIGDANW